jgi:hypothetical protein
VLIFAFAFVKKGGGGRRGRRILWIAISFSGVVALGRRRA